MRSRSATPSRRRCLTGLLCGAALAFGGAPIAAQAQAQDKVLNLYSARHYQTDEALYSNFTKATGIKINRVDADDAGILSRLQSEGTASPADVILLVDAARLWRAEESGLFQPIRSELLASRDSRQPALGQRRTGCNGSDCRPVRA